MPTIAPWLLLYLLTVLHALQVMITLITYITKLKTNFQKLRGVFMPKNMAGNVNQTKFIYFIPKELK
jgi:hypothetical protein